MSSSEAQAQTGDPGLRVRHVHLVFAASPHVKGPGWELQTPVLKVGSPPCEKHRSPAPAQTC